MGRCNKIKINRTGAVAEAEAEAVLVLETSREVLDGGCPSAVGRSRGRSHSRLCNLIVPHQLSLSVVIGVQGFSLGLGWEARGRFKGTASLLLLQQRPPGFCQNSVLKLE
jgi:hypothetical protein